MCYEEVMKWRCTESHKARREKFLRVNAYVLCDSVKNKGICAIREFTLVTNPNGDEDCFECCGMTPQFKYNGKYYDEMEDVLKDMGEENEGKNEGNEESKDFQ
jgi:hypothetical protein